MARCAVCFPAPDRRYVPYGAVPAFAAITAVETHATMRRSSSTPPSSLMMFTLRTSSTQPAHYRDETMSRARAHATLNTRMSMAPYAVSICARRERGAPTLRPCATHAPLSPATRYDDCWPRHHFPPAFMAGQPREGHRRHRCATIGFPRRSRPMPVHHRAAHRFTPSACSRTRYACWRYAFEDSCCQPALSTAVVRFRRPPAAASPSAAALFDDDGAQRLLFDAFRSRRRPPPALLMRSVTCRC